MTLRYMRSKLLSYALTFAVAAAPALVSAQAGQAAAAAAKAAQSAAPTGPMSAMTKAAAAVRASRAAATASRAGAAAGAGAGKSTAVMGYLWTANNSPISNATIQLRNTVTNQVEIVSKTN